MRSVHKVINIFMGNLVSFLEGEGSSIAYSVNGGKLVVHRKPFSDDRTATISPKDALTAIDYTVTSISEALGFPKITLEVIVNGCYSASFDLSNG